MEGWTGAWCGLALLAAWFCGHGLRPLLLEAVTAGGGGAGWIRGTSAPAVVLVAALGAAAWGLARLSAPSIRFSARCRAGGAVLPWLVCGVLGLVSGWRGASNGVVAPVAVENTAGDAGFWIIRIERIDWTRSPPVWSGHAFARLEAGRWRAISPGIASRGVWERPETGAFLAHATPGRSHGGEALMLRIGRVWRLTGASGAGAQSRGARQAEVRARLCARAVQAMGPEAGALAARTLLGPVPQLPTDWERSFRETGTMHLLSISGFHLTLIGGILWMVTRVLSRGAAWAHWPALVALGLYSDFVGATAPVLRSCGAAYLLAVRPAWGRRYRAWNALGWTAAVLVAIDPRVAAGVSFRLSFGAMAGVFWGGALPWPKARGWARLRAPAQVLAASIGATLMTAPWSLHYFGVLYPLGVAANLVAIPAMAVTLVAQGCALLAVAAGAGPTFPFVAIGRACGEGFLAGIDLLATVCSRRPWIGGCDPTAALAWTVLLGLLLHCAARGFGLRRWRRTLPWVALATIPVVLSTHAARRREAPFAHAPGEVTFLDVGQGDAALLRLGQARWLVDLGIGSIGGRRDRLVPALLARGVRRVDRVWITHGDADHWGGLVDLLASPVRVDTLALSAGAPYPEDLWQTLAAASQRPVVLRVGAGWERAVGPGLRCRILHPPSSFGPGDARPGSSNAWSLVLYVEGIGAEPGHIRRLLISGDLEKEREAGMLRVMGAGLPITVATLAHHGSRTAGSEPWWHRVRPALGVISVGAGNPYGLPHPLTLAAARRHAAIVRRTDEGGALRVTIGADAPCFRAERPALPASGPCDISRP